MSITITPESKHTLAITNEVKGPQPTWDDRLNTWNEALGTWATPDETITLDAKNMLTITNAAKT